MTAAVYDDANPTSRALTNLTVEVKRNEKRPSFRQNDYSVTVLEIAAVGSSVARVQASDDDDGVSRSLTHGPTQLHSTPFSKHCLRNLRDLCAACRTWF